MSELGIRAKKKRKKGAKSNFKYKKLSKQSRTRKLMKSWKIKMKIVTIRTLKRLPSGKDEKRI